MDCSRTDWSTIQGDTASFQTLPSGAGAERTPLGPAQWRTIQWRCLPRCVGTWQEQPWQSLERQLDESDASGATCSNVEFCTTEEKKSFGWIKLVHICRIAKRYRSDAKNALCGKQVRQGLKEPSTMDASASSDAKHISLHDGGVVVTQAPIDRFRTFLLFFFPALGGLLFGAFCTLQHSVSTKSQSICFVKAPFALLSCAGVLVTLLTFPWDTLLLQSEH